MFLTVLLVSPYQLILKLYQTFVCGREYVEVYIKDILYT